MLGRLRSSSLTAAAHPPPVRQQTYPLDMELLQFPDGSHWLLRDLFEHVHVFGGPGSGKSSGSLAALYRLCATDMGMLCLTAKEDEPGRLIDMALQAGRREEDIIVIDDTLDVRFNFLNYEATRRGGGDTFTIVETLLSMVEARRRQQQNYAGQEAPFWRDAAHEMLTHCINVLRISKDNRLHMADIYKFLSSMPRERNDLRDRSFYDRSYAFDELAKATHITKAKNLGPEVELARNYMVQNAKGDVRTSGNILVTITSMLQPFLSGTLHELFCTETNWTPELVLEQGKLTIIAFPTLLYKQLGVLAQVIFKAAFAQACGARVDDPNSIPVILYADEAQNFMTEDDARLAEMGRSKRVAMVYGTQNIGNYVRALGGQNAQIITESMLGNFGTLFFHANKHPATNEFASKIIGRRMQYRRTAGTSSGRSGGISGGDSRATSGNKSWTRSIAENWGISRGKSKSRQKGTSYSQGGGYSSSTDQPYPMGTYSTNHSGGKNASQSVSENISQNEGGNQSESYAESIGTTHTTQRGWNRSVNEGQSQSVSEHMDSDLEPAIFVGGLATGGPEHDFAVDAVVVRTGRTFHDRNWTKVSFRQE